MFDFMSTLMHSSKIDEVNFWEIICFVGRGLRVCFFSNLDIFMVSTFVDLFISFFKYAFHGGNWASLFFPHCY